MIETETTTWTCPVCRERSDQTFVQSRSGLPPGPPDLDARRLEDKVHGVIAYEIWLCPWCGFTQPPAVAQPPPVAQDAAPVSEAVAALVHSYEYRYQPRAEVLPPLANAYLCRAMIEREGGRIGRAGWIALKAAWACDDRGDKPGGRYCRSRAVELWEEAENAGEPIVEKGTPARQLLLADVLRRARRFEEAKDRCQRGRSGRPAEPFRSLLAFESELAARGDTDAHAVSERVAVW